MSRNVCILFQFWLYHQCVRKSKFPIRWQNYWIREILRLISGIFDCACTELPHISTSSSESDTTNMFGDPAFLYKGADILVTWSTICKIMALALVCMTLNSHSRSSFLVPNEILYATLYQHSILQMSLSCSVSEILPIFHNKIQFLHIPSLFHLTLPDDRLRADWCLFTT